MKMNVLRGVWHPLDRARKTDRRAVVLGEDQQYICIAPATTWFQRGHAVPAGHVLLTVKSAAYVGSGFDKNEILISIRDAVIVRKDSIYLKESQKVGELNLDKDARFRDGFVRVLREFPPGRQCI